jgi:drug/metabolite transporter (DMT)-like permease
MSKRGGGVWNAFFMISYLILGATEYLCVRKISERHQGLPFHAPAAVVIIEGIKLFITIGLLTIGGTWHRFSDVTLKDARLLVVPACMYFVLNTLFYIAVSSVVLATYAIIFECQIILVAILHRFVCGRSLVSSQQIACVGLVLGALVQYAGESHASGNWYATVMLLPMFVAVWTASCTVTCEYVFKQGISLDINVQNSYLYSFGIALGCILLSLVRWHRQMEWHELMKGFTYPEVMVLLSIRAFHGIATSRILKYIDSFSKTIGSVLTGPLSIGLAPFLVDEHITTYTVVAIAITYSSSLMFWLKPEAAKQEEALAAKAQAEEPINNKPVDRPSKNDV